MFVFFAPTEFINQYLKKNIKEKTRITWIPIYFLLKRWEILVDHSGQGSFGFQFNFYSKDGKFLSIIADGDFAKSYSEDSN